MSIKEEATAYLINAGLSKATIGALESAGYFTAPASKSHHLNIEGGLARHSINVARNMLALKPFKDAQSNYRVGMLHDLVKVFCYRAKKSGGYEFVSCRYPGHGTASALFCAEFGIELSQAERMAIIHHMGAYALDEKALRELQAATRRFPREILLTHAADNLASIFESRREAANEAD